MRKTLAACAVFIAICLSAAWIQQGGTGQGFATSPFVTLADSATITWPVGGVGNAQLTFTAHSGSRTLNVSGLTSGGNYVIELIQDGTGGEGLTGGTGCTWKQMGGGGSTFTLTSTAGARDVVAFTYDGTNCLANVGRAYN
jgi:hypothetical protein